MQKYKIVCIGFPCWFSSVEYLYASSLRGKLSCANFLLFLREYEENTKKKVRKISSENILKSIQFHRHNFSSSITIQLAKRSINECWYKTMKTRLPFVLKRVGRNMFDDLKACSYCWPFNYPNWIGSFVESSEKGSSYEIVIYVCPLKHLLRASTIYVREKRQFNLERVAKYSPSQTFLIRSMKHFVLFEFQFAGVEKQKAESLIAIMSH